MNYAKLLFDYFYSKASYRASKIGAKLSKLNVTQLNVTQLNSTQLKATLKATSLG